MLRLAHLTLMTQRRDPPEPFTVDRRTALRLYLFSMLYLALLFAAMVADIKF